MKSDGDGMGSKFSIKTYEFNESDINTINLEKYNDFPIVYIIYTTTLKKPLAYIGQTIHAKRRMKEHYSNKKRKKLEDIMIVAHDKFNQSATYNFETNLINYFLADGKFMLQNKSQTTNSQMHNYFEKKYYNFELFGKLWQFLMDEKLVNDSLDVLKNKDVYKLSPFKELSQDQLELKDNIIEICKEKVKLDRKFVYFIEGEAGTGKSVVLSAIFNEIQDLTKENSSAFYKTNNYLLVNHNEMLKTYEKISESLPNLHKKNFQKPTPFINGVDNEKLKEADIVLVDEAHLLLSKSDNFNNFTYENQLEEIIKRSKVTVVVFDKKQVLKLKSHWDKSKLEKIKEKYDFAEFKLTTQFRVQASDEVLEWMNAFVEKKILPIPKTQDKLTDNKFELKIFNDAQKMYEAIKNKDDKEGLSRVVSTFDYIHKKDGGEYFIEEGDFKLPWNRTTYKETWAEHPDTINEVGSIYTIQGFDLNYVGVILGPSVSYDERTNRLTIDPSKYRDTEAFRSRADLKNSAQANIKEEIILNSINILMKRGVHGLYIYASDEKLRKRLKELSIL
ncbi:DUF2075 domain-containing protein [Jeotgalibaca dankookensis]|uniref:DUF2075 domain-containing protein n=1 Tax=Jeotgalibaca dankookensis TaxID=708126 RepID=UPI001F44C0A3|nr:DUF2075 domain-containing protein [Jeotgalibaca dankookensis]